MKSALTLSIGILIGLGLNLLWQNRIYEPNELLSDGSLESSYDTFIDSLVKAGEFVQTHEYYGSDREKAQAYIHILSSLISVIKQEIFIDTSFPYFNNLSTFSKVGMDNADQTYHQTFIDGSGRELEDHPKLSHLPHIYQTPCQNHCMYLMNLNMSKTGVLK